MLYSGKMITLNKKQEKFKKEFLNPIKFSLYFFKNVPMGWFSGMKLKKLSEKMLFHMFLSNGIIDGRIKIHSDLCILQYKVWEQNFLQHQ